MTDRTLTVTVFDDLGGAWKDDCPVPWGEFADFLREAVTRVYRDKDDRPLASLGTYGDQRTEKGSLRSVKNRRAVSGVECDLDNGMLTLEDVQQRLQGIEAIIVPSASHTEDHPRLHVYVPLSRDYRPEDRAQFVRQLNHLLDGNLADESFSDHLALYIGPVRGGAELVIERTRGKFLDQIPDLPECGKASKRNDHPETSSKIQEGDRHNTLVKMGGLVRRAGTSPEATAAVIQTINATDCDPPLSEDELLRIMRDIGSKSPGNPNDDLKFAGESGLTERFAQRYANQFRYVSDLGKWHVWDGTRWKKDIRNAVTAAAMEMCSEIGAVVRASKAFDNDKARIRWARYFESARIIEATVRLASKSPALVLTSDQLDADDFLFNTADGTVDLRTGVMRPHNPRDLITKLAGASLADIPCPVFEKFLDDITCGDSELAEYLQTALGACLSGAVNDHWLMFWYGEGRNGKNTLGDTVMKLMGEYAKVVPTQTLMTDRHSNRHPTEIANLRGVRLAVSSEVSAGQYWDDSKLNSLTGDTMLSARSMRTDHFEFPRTHKHLIYGNNQPRLRIVNPAISERMHIVPFRATFTAALGNEDRKMPKKLLCEGAGILQWLVDGHLRWRKEGLRRCKAVGTATGEYLKSQSTVEMWVDQCLVIVKDDGRSASQWMKGDDLYMDYRRWKERNGEFPLSRPIWGSQMGKQYKTKTSNGVRYVGVASFKK